MKNEERIIRLNKNFEKIFNEKPCNIFSSPGRIEILGNHTDHNHGLVLVGAIDLNTLAATKKENNNFIEIYSEGYNFISVNLNDLTCEKEEEGKSISLIKGIAFKMQKNGYKIGGFKAYINSNVPAGSGVSSSASFECLIIEILNHYYNEDKITSLEIAKIGQYAENKYFNKPCGLLDQCGVALGGVNLIDFKSIKNPSITHIEPYFNNYDIVLINCGGDHSNLTEHYSLIRKEMEEVALFFKKKHLRDVPYKKFINEIDELRYFTNDRAILRALHFYNENNLVKKALKYVKNNNIKKFLACINESGNSSYMLLQNTNVPGSTRQNINLALAISKTIIKDGACRIHGGGFEGTIITFINKNETNNYIEVMSNIFKKDNIFKINLRNHGTKKEI